METQIDVAEGAVTGLFVAGKVGDRDMITVSVKVPTPVNEWSSRTHSLTVPASAGLSLGDLVRVTVERIPAAS